MTGIAKFLASHKIVLRSGHADGADMAFEDGVIDPELKEIWIPWKGFNGSKSTLTPTNDAFILAARFHPHWKKLKEGAKKLHARNGHQILGADLQSPVSFVICWTEDGLASGGTGQALRIAHEWKIPVFNLFNPNDKSQLSEFLRVIKDGNRPLGSIDQVSLLSCLSQTRASGNDFWKLHDG
jgi:hypothetical protein